MNNKEKAIIINFLYLLIVVLTCIPLTCGYVMESGEIMSWLARGEEVYHGLRDGTLILYPSETLVITYGMYSSAFDSSLWLYIYAIIRCAGVSITTAYIIYMLLIQIGTFLTARKLFHLHFQDQVSRFFGVLFYITCPYRVYLCYDQGNLGRCIAWMLLPLVGCGLLEMRQGCKRKWSGYLLAVAALSGIGYADVVLFAVTLGCIVIGGILHRKSTVVAVAGVSCILFLPGAAYLIKYLLYGGMSDWHFPILKISSYGYNIGYFFTSFVYEENLPGLGLGLIGAICIWYWLRLMGETGCKQYKFYEVIAVVLMTMSMAAFPWEFVQRLGGLFLKCVSLIETPVVFFGMACAFWTIPAAAALGKIHKHENSFVKWGIPIMLFVATIAVEIYICNNLMYSRMAKTLIDHI